MPYLMEKFAMGTMQLMMPDYPGINDLLLRPASFRRESVGVIGFVDAVGGTANLRVKVDGKDLTQGELDAIRNIAGDMSNAGVYTDRIDFGGIMNKADAVAVDDTIGQVSTRLVMVFVRDDDDRIKWAVELPAPKREFLVQGNGEFFVDTNNATFQSLVTAIENGFNATLPDGEPNYAFQRAYVSDRKAPKVGGRITPTIAVGVDP